MQKLEKGKIRDNKDQEIKFIILKPGPFKNELFLRIKH